MRDLILTLGGVAVFAVFLVVGVNYLTPPNELYPFESVLKYGIGTPEPERGMYAHLKCDQASVVIDASVVETSATGTIGVEKMEDGCLKIIHLRMSRQEGWD